jgi:hypothetical protein
MMVTIKQESCLMKMSLGAGNEVEANMHNQCEGLMTNNIPDIVGGEMGPITVILESLRLEIT